MLLQPFIKGSWGPLGSSQEAAPTGVPRTDCPVLFCGLQTGTLWIEISGQCGCIHRSASPVNQVPSRAPGKVLADFACGGCPSSILTHRLCALNSPQVLPEALSCPLHTAGHPASLHPLSQLAQRKKANWMKSFTSLKTDGQLVSYLPRNICILGVSWKSLTDLSFRWADPCFVLPGLWTAPASLTPVQPLSPPAAPERKLSKPHLKEDHFISLVIQGEGQWWGWKRDLGKRRRTLY